MSDERFLKEDLIHLRRDLGFTQQQMATELDMALRSYQSIESGESEYRYIHRLAAERIALAVAADKGAPSLAPAPVRNDAIELVRAGRATRDPAFDLNPNQSGPSDKRSVESGEDKFRAGYSLVGELVLIATALDHQLNHVLIHVLHLASAPMLESVVATLDTVRKVEILKARTKYISVKSWQKPVLMYIEKVEHVSKWRNIACHTPLIPDEKDGAVFASTAAAKLLKSLQIGKDPPDKRIPVEELRRAISTAEVALGEGQNLIRNFQKVEAELKRRLGT
jgi:transcriptional regulator with XRE-family HTH domain